MSGSREPGRVGLPARALPPSLGLRVGMRPGDPRAEPTPAPEPGSNLTARPHLGYRGAAPSVRPSPEPGHRRDEAPRHPRARGSSQPPGRGGKRWGGRGPLIPAPPPAPSPGLGLALGLGPGARARISRCVRAGQWTRAGGPEGRASLRGRCSSLHPGRWPSRATSARAGRLLRSPAPRGARASPLPGSGIGTPAEQRWEGGPR